MKRALILDGDQRSALAVVRSLGRRGVEVHVAAAKIPCLAGSSSYASSQLNYPDPRMHPQEFVRWVSGVIAALSLDFVFPVTDVSTMLLAPDATSDTGGCLACAPRAAYEAVTDKHRLVQLAERVGVCVPDTHVASSLEEADALLAAARFPIVLKPARSHVLLEDRIVSTSVAVVRSREEGLRYLQGQSWLGVVPCLFQEFVEGHGAGVFALYSNGHPQAWFAHRRVREKPPKGGVSVLSESVSLSPSLQAAAARLLDEVSWSGPAMIEFRIARDGTPMLMEINGRWWGSLQLAIDCGVDFPWLMLRADPGSHQVAFPEYAAGSRLRWYLGDLDNLMLECRGKGLAKSGWEKLKVAAEFLATSFAGNVRNEVLRREDPAPGVFELKHWLGNLLGRQ